MALTADDLNRFEQLIEDVMGIWAGSIYDRCGSAEEREREYFDRTEFYILAKEAVNELRGQTS